MWLDLHPPMDRPGDKHSVFIQMANKNKQLIVLCQYSPEIKWLFHFRFYLLWWYIGKMYGQEKYLSYLEGSVVSRTTGYITLCNNASHVCTRMPRICSLMHTVTDRRNLDVIWVDSVIYSTLESRVRARMDAAPLLAPALMTSIANTKPSKG